MVDAYKVNYTTCVSEVGKLSNISIAISNSHFNRKPLRCSICNPDENYLVLTNVFSNIVNIHAPLKKKILRGNDAPFMTKELRKAIYTSSRLRNRYFKNPTKENETSHKKQRNKSVSLRRKSITQHFSKITSKGIMTNKQFWKTMKPFLTNKGCLENNDIILLDGEEMITNDRILAKRFNEHYINIVERSTGFKPSKMSFSVESRNNHFLRSIANQYRDYPSTVNIRQNALNNNYMDTSSFSTDEVTPDKVNSIIKSLDANKASDTDKIPIKLIILASDLLSKPISKALNNCITSCTFPESAKVATVVPIDKKADDKYVIPNYRPVSLLKGFSNIYEIHLNVTWFLT